MSEHITYKEKKQFAMDFTVKKNDLFTRANLEFLNSGHGSLFEMGKSSLFETFISYLA